MHCKECGSPIPKEAKYCGYCGAAIKKDKRPSKKMQILSLGALVALYLLFFREPSNDTSLKSPAESMVPIQQETLQNQIAEPTEIVISARKNQLMEDSISIDDVQVNWSADDKYKLYVLGSDVHRETIRSITFLNTQEDSTSEEALDVSANQDGSVLAWFKITDGTELYDLYIAADGNTLAPENCATLFAGYENLEELHFNDCFDTSQVTDMSGMFMSCGDFEMLDLSCFDTSKVQNMAYMFSGCGAEELDISSFNTENVLDMKEMFATGTLLKLDLSHFNTSKVIDMSGMFQYCIQLKQLNLSSFDTSQVTDMASMFSKTMNLKKLDLSALDTSSVESMSCMFYNSGVEKLDVSGFDTSNVVNMGGMFEKCSGLKSLDLSNFDTSNVTDMSCMFYWCTSLNKLDISGFDFSNYSEYSKKDILVMLFNGDDTPKYFKINYK